MPLTEIASAAAGDATNAGTFVAEIAGAMVVTAAMPLRPTLT